jgi:hypothetical protein
VWLVHEGVTFEQRALAEPHTITALLVLLAVVAAGVRWGTAALARSELMDLQYEEVPPPAVMGLGLIRDGVMTVGPPDQ